MSYCRECLHDEVCSLTHCGQSIACCNFVNADRYHEIMHAEREGRLVIPPCKVGDTVWCVSKAYKTVTLYTVAGFLNDGMRWKARLVKTIPSWVGNQKEHKYVAFGAFGKTVFLTREAAEKALEKANG